MKPRGMKLIDIERIDDSLAIVVRGPGPYTVCRCSRWELWKMAIWSLFR